MSPDSLVGHADYTAMWLGFSMGDSSGMLKALQQGDIEGRLRALEAVEGSRSKKSGSTVNHDDSTAPVSTIYSR